MSTLAQLRDLRNRLAESDRLRSTVDHAADIAALDALLGAADARDHAESLLAAFHARLEGAEGALWATVWATVWARHTKAAHQLTAARARIDAILRGEL